MSLTINELGTEHVFEGQWITDMRIKNDKKSSPEPITFLKKFCVNKRVSRAMLYATAIGNYFITVNGKKITDEMLSPGYTGYKKILQYQAYDITDKLENSNELLVVVSGGWAVGLFGFTGVARSYAPRQLFRCDLVITYMDGSTETYATDENWQVTMDGAYTLAGIYEGVRFDARWASSKASWRNADVSRFKYTPSLRCTYGVLPYRQEHLNPVECHTSKRGGTIYDFGQNCSAVVCLHIKNAKAGQTIIIRHSEILLDNEIFTSNLRKADATVTYICREGEQDFSPELTTMGFRYVRVQGINPENLEITAQVVSSLAAPTGGFSCSDERLNRLQQNIQWGARSNFVDIPTDCPQRDERMGWTGDIAVFASTACFNFDTARFFDKWLLDVINEQGFGGGIPFVVPAGKYPIPPFASAGWADCAALVPFAQYQKDGNTRLIERQYESITKLLKAEQFWSGFLSLGKNKYIWKLPFQFGDWLAPGESLKQWSYKGKWIATAYFYNTARIAAILADTLGKQQDSKKYRDLMVKIEEAYRDVFTDGHGKLHEEFQSGYICPIHFGMLTEEERIQMGDRLASLARKNEYKIETGFLGTPYLLFALSDTGHTETAYRVLMNEECPGWLYSVKLGATTIWERWDALRPDGTVNLSRDYVGGKGATSADFDPEDQSASSMTSFNHYAYGAVGDWLYRRVAGLECIEPGWRHFKVKPVPGGNLTWAEAHTETPYGSVSARWEIKDDSFNLDINVPKGTSCQAVLPNGETHEVSGGTHHFTCAL